MPVPHFTNKIRIFVLLLSVFLIYWGLVPVFLPLPRITVDMPEETPIDEDVPIKVKLDAWHPNFEVSQIRFYADYARSDVDGPNGPFYPQILFQSDKQIHWTFGRVNRFAWPRQREIDVKLPLARLARDGVIKPGKVYGKIDVTLSYPDLHTRTYRAMGERYNRTRMISKPFTMEFLPATGSSSVRAQIADPVSGKGNS